VEGRAREGQVACQQSRRNLATNREEKSELSLVANCFVQPDPVSSSGRALAHHIGPPHRHTTIPRCGFPVAGFT
jgi:hypothetical protein